ncbi:MAG: arcadin 1 [Nitrososphaerota archaeon]
MRGWRRRRWRRVSNSRMVLVKVQRVTSYTDPETARPGKIVELVEIRRSGVAVKGTGLTDESVMVQRLLQSAVMQLQSMGLMPISREMMFPKIVLYLTEEEYDLLNVRLEVNEVYEVTFRDGQIVFSRPQGLG